jgi:hypothetical protein
MANNELETILKEAARSRGWMGITKKEDYDKEESQKGA